MAAGSGARRERPATPTSILPFQGEEAASGPLEV